MYWNGLLGFVWVFVWFGFGFFYSRKDERYGSLGKKYELRVGFLDWHVDENEFLSWQYAC